MVHELTNRNCHAPLRRPTNISAEYILATQTAEKMQFPSRSAEQWTQCVCIRTNA